MIQNLIKHPFAKIVYGLYKNGMNLQGIVTTIIQQNPQAAKFLEQAQSMAKGKSPEQLENFVMNFARERNVPDWVLQRAKKYAQNPSQPLTEIIPADRR